MNGKVKCIQDEIPFEIPESWVWCRLGNICEINLGFTYKPKYFSEGIPFLSVSNLKDNEIDYKNCNYISLEEYKKASYGSKPLKGDILFGRVGSIGRPQIVNVDFPFCIFVSLGFLRFFSFPIFNKYVLLYINSNLFKNLVKRIAKGTGRINLNTGWLKTFLFPLPPINEQNYIVNKYGAIHESIQLVENTIVNKNKKKQILKFKVLNTVFSSNSSYKSYYENGYTIENDAEILDNLRKPINAIEREQRLSKSNERYPYYGATGQVGFINEYLIDGEYVLVGEDGAPFLDKHKNKAYIINGKSWVNNHAHILKSKSNNKFLMYYLNWFNYQDYVSGTTRLKLTQGNLRKIPFINITKEEKDKIVLKLDKIFKLIDNI